MVISTDTYLSGVELEPGDTLEGHYDLVIDETAEDIYEEFLEYGFDEETVLKDAAEFIDQNIRHTYDMVSEKGLEPEEFDRERREVQGRISRVRISEVWENEYRGVRAGTCRERAATLHLLLDELDIGSKYYSGFVDENRREGHSWIETRDRTIVDPSSDQFVLAKSEAPHSTGRVMVRSGSGKGPYGKVDS